MADDAAEKFDMCEEVALRARAVNKKARLIAEEFALKNGPIQAEPSLSSPTGIDQRKPELVSCST